MLYERASATHQQYRIAEREGTYGDRTAQRMNECGGWSALWIALDIDVLDEAARFTAPAIFRPCITWLVDFVFCCFFLLVSMFDWQVR